jgi:hypothetical protein
LYEWDEGFFAVDDDFQLVSAVPVAAREMPKEFFSLSRFPLLNQAMFSSVISIPIVGLANRKCFTTS